MWLRGDVRVRVWKRGERTEGERGVKKLESKEIKKGRKKGES